MLGVTPNTNNVVDIARTIQPIIIGGSTSVLIYLSSKKIFKSEIYGYLSAILFAVSPGVYAYSRFAYPDHYVYFFSAAVMYFLIRYLDNQLKKDLVLAAVFTSLAFSVKYSGIFLLVPVMVATHFGVTSNANRLSRLKISLLDARWPLAFACLAFFIVNLSAFLQPKLFIDGLLFNSSNYASFSGGFFENFVYYFIILCGISFGMLSLPFLLMGWFELYRKNIEIFVVLISFPLALMLYLSTLGLALNRNMSIALPFVVIPLTAAIKFLVNGFKAQNRTRRITVSLAISLVIGAGALQFSQSFQRDFQSDSRVVAHKWIDENLDRELIIGTNEFCSGHSPAHGLGFETIQDASFSKNLPLYVVNSYWNSPFDPYYKEATPYWLELDQKYIHFYHFNDTKVSRFARDETRIEDLVPAGYFLVKSFTSNGPDVLILRKEPE